MSKYSLFQILALILSDTLAPMAKLGEVKTVVGISGKVLVPSEGIPDIADCAVLTALVTKVSGFGDARVGGVTPTIGASRNELAPETAAGCAVGAKRSVTLSVTRLTMVSIISSGTFHCAGVGGVACTGPPAFRERRWVGPSALVAATLFRWDRLTVDMSRYYLKATEIHFGRFWMP